MESIISVNDIICRNIDSNPLKTIVYISVGSAEVPNEIFYDNSETIITDPTIRANLQQLPPFIRKYMHKHPDHNIITIMIDKKFNIKPKIIKDTHIEEEIGNTVKLYMNDSNDSSMIITIEEYVRWAEPRHECEKDVIDIRNFIKNIAINCYNKKCCLIMESFTGDSLFKLRNFIDIECKDYIHFLDKCMIGLTVNGNYCHPDLTSKEYDINIHFTEENGIYVDNHHHIIKYPKLYKLIFAKSLTSDYSLAIRLSKLLNLKAEIVCDSILTLARMAVSLNVDCQSVNYKIYDDIINYTNSIFEVNIIDKVDFIFDFLSVKIDELFKFISSEDTSEYTNLKSSIINFKNSKNPYNDFSHIKKTIMGIFSVLE